MDSLKSSLENSESKINSLNKESIDQRKLISELENKIHTCLKWANQNEQYSRRNNIKITGLKTSENEDTRLSVCNFLKDKLGIKSKAGDIDAAHILPKGINQKGQKDERPPNIIVKFMSRDARDEAIRRRKQLKGSGIVILEDLTTMNVKLMNRVNNHDQIERSWSQNGKIIGLTKGGAKIRFELFDNIQNKLII